jgi:hypothetical protein
MKITSTLGLVFLALFVQTRLPAAEVITSAASLAFPAIQDAGSARAIALGSTYVGIAEGSATLPWNPAGLAELCTSEFSVNHNSTVEGSFQESALLGVPLGHSSGLGASFSFADNGTFEGRDENGNVDSTYEARAYGGSLGWGLRLPADLAVGAAVKVNREDLDTTGYNDFAADFGALWTPSPSFTLGAAYTNLGLDVADAHLAQGFSLGASSYLFKGEDLQWLFAISGEALTHSDGSIHFGVEPTFYHVLSLRAGYGFNVPYTDNGTDPTGWTLGGGIKLDQLSVDYAYVPLADLGNVQRISLTYAFGDCVNPAPARKTRNSKL